MKKLQNHKPIQQLPTPLLRRKSTWALLILIVLVAAGLTMYFVQRHIQERRVAAERAEFSDLHYKIRLVNRNTLNLIGDPLADLNDNNCSKPNVKFEDSFLSCNVGFTVIYATTDLVNANEHIEKINALVEGSLGKTTPIDNSNPTDRFLDPGNDTNEQTVFRNINTAFKNFNCSMASRYYFNDNPPFHDYAVESSTRRVLALTIGCSKQAYEKYF